MSFGAAAYLTDILAANIAGLAAAWGDITCARGMTEIARSAGTAREALYIRRYALAASRASIQ